MKEKVCEGMRFSPLLLGVTRKNEVQSPRNSRLFSIAREIKVDREIKKMYSTKFPTFLLLCVNWFHSLLSPLFLNSSLTPFVSKRNLRALIRFFVFKVRRKEGKEERMSMRKSSKTTQFQASFVDLYRDPEFPNSKIWKHSQLKSISFFACRVNFCFSFPFNYPSFHPPKHYLYR